MKTTCCYRRLLVLAALSLLAPLPLVRSQNPPPAAALPVSPATLAQTLTQIRPPSHVIVIAVDADKSTLRKNAGPPRP